MLMVLTFLIWILERRMTEPTATVVMTLRMFLQCVLTGFFVKDL